MNRTLSVYLIAALLPLAAALAQGTFGPSHCADCHMGLAGEEMSDPHLVDWSNSPHRRSDVGCEQCHGGNAAAFEQHRAHEGILPTSHPDSPTHFTNLPATCGRCHGAIFSAYAESPHYGLLRQGERNSPSCVTCHGEVAAQSLGTGGIQARCDRCHAADGEGASSVGVARGAGLLSRYRDISKVRDRLERRIQRVRSDALRHDLEAAFFGADTAWQEAIEAGHGFDYDDMEAALDESGQAFEALLAQVERLR